MDNGGDKIPRLLSEIVNGNLEAVRILLETGTNPNITINNITALMVAAQTGHREIVQILLEAGANVHFKDNSSFSALIYAVKKGYVNIVADLIGAGSDVNMVTNFHDNTALHFATWIDSPFNRKEIVLKLLTAGADINAKNEGGNTPLILAANQGDKEIVQILLEAGADVSVIAKDGKKASELAKEIGEDVIVHMINGTSKEKAITATNDRTEKQYDKLKSTDWTDTGAQVNFDPKFIKSSYATPVFISTNSPMCVGKKSARKCIRCKELYLLHPCPNCGEEGFVPSLSTERIAGLFCHACNKGFTNWICPNCNTENPISKSLVAKDERMCFIATATFGSASAEEVVALSDFRDNFLLSYSLGRKFVKFYYLVSPSIANIISGSSLFKKLSLLVLVKPIVNVIRLVGNTRCK